MESGLHRAKGACGRIPPWLLIAMAALVLQLASPVVQAHAGADPNGGPVYLDLLDMHGAPGSATDRGFNIFFDDGAWQGYSLPPSGDKLTGFIGPFVQSLGSGRWVGLHFARLSLNRAGDGPVSLHLLSAYAAPGYLRRCFGARSLRVCETLFFASSWSALVRIDLTSERPQQLGVSISGELMPDHRGTLVEHDGVVVQTFPRTATELITRIHGPASANTSKVSATTSDSGYVIAIGRPLHLDANRTSTVFVEQTLLQNGRTARPEPVDLATAWQGNRKRWARYLGVASAAHLEGLADATARRVAVKAMLTLLGNWRAPRGDLHHAGVIPSYSNPDFNGFWSWDSWKQAAALALFAPGLARDNILAMFDYQAPDGMVPDVIFMHKADDNWRDTKPPLATWAVLKVYDATHDKAFLVRMYPGLVRYHDWWFSARDHDHDGLAEYGATDGTKIAARWESGMDNAARFDDITMLKNGSGAWSMNQESVDLNAYLYRDATGLGRIAGLLGKTRDHAAWLKKASAMKARIQDRFFDRKSGYFFDAELGSRKLVHIFGPEGWIPLWAGAASKRQAESVARILRDPHKFDTFIPFPTLAADDPRFSPVTGYWRGPVWLDQAYFGVAGLRRYGFGQQANRMALQLVLNAQGLTRQAPIRENYDPLNGKGQNSRNFSWSAASYLLLLLPSRPSPTAGVH